jgi:hypothetical protein
MKVEEWWEGRVDDGDGVVCGGGENEKGVVGERKKQGCYSGYRWRGGVGGIGEGEDEMSGGDGQKVMAD